jgi:hypothetical protein
MFIKTKKHSGKYYYRLNHSKREGRKVRSFSVYLGSSLALSAQQWIDKLAGAKGFQPRVRDVLPLVEAYVCRHNLPWETLKGIQEAMRVEAERSRPSSAHRVLGVTAGASIADIEVAYRRLSKTLHPDMGGDAEAFRKLTEARDKLAPRPVRHLAPTEAGTAGLRTKR